VDRFTTAVRWWRRQAREAARRRFLKDAAGQAVCPGWSSTAERVLSCWRMVDWKLGKVLGNEPVWDPEHPRVDVVFCMDTTGSMRSSINRCRQQVRVLIMHSVASRQEYCFQRITQE
jgi:hypothetical protein